MVAEINRMSDGYEAGLRERLDELGIVIQRTPEVDHMEIARRASAGRTPFTRNKDGKTKDGYRDTLIWLTVIAVAQQNPSDEVWLVSDNHLDFGPKRGNWTGPGSGDLEDCRILFDDDLAEERADHSLTERVHYVLSAERLELHLASQFAPITGADLDRMVATIEMTTLGAKLMYAALGLDLDPEAAALPVEVAGAQIVGVREQQEGWTFSEAARRGDAGWTARFAVDTEVDISMVEAPLIGSEDTKVLRLLGRVTVSPECDIGDMAVDSAEALPSDPMRARWVRRRERDASFVGFSAGSFAETPMAWKTQQDQLMKDAAERFSAASLAEAAGAWKTQQDQLMKDAVERFGTTGIADDESDPASDADPPPVDAQTDDQSH
jgi:hypothetical protein